MQILERETGIEPATNGLGSRDSTTELLPPVIAITAEIVTLCAIPEIHFQDFERSQKSKPAGLLVPPLG